MSVKISQMQPATSDFLKDVLSTKLEVTVNDSGLGNLTRSVSKEVLTRRFTIPQQTVNTSSLLNRDDPFSILKIDDTTLQEFASLITDNQEPAFNFDQILAVGGTVNLHYTFSDFETYQFISLPFSASVDTYGQFSGFYVEYMTGFGTVFRRQLPDFQSWNGSRAVGLQNVTAYGPGSQPDGTRVEIFAKALIDLYDPAVPTGLRVGGFADLSIILNNTSPA